MAIQNFWQPRVPIWCPALFIKGWLIDASLSFILIGPIIVFRKFTARVNSYSPAIALLSFRTADRFRPVSLSGRVFLKRRLQRTFTASPFPATERYDPSRSRHTG